MRPHRLDPLSLFFGVIFLLAGIPFLAGVSDVSSVHGGGLWPVPVIALGFLVLLVALASARRSGNAPDRDEDPS